MISIAHPVIDNETKRSIAQVLDSGNLTQGEITLKFELLLRKKNKTRYAIATNSGTAALLAALVSLKLDAGSEIITSPLSFIATANTIILANLKPIFCDINERTFNIESKLVEERITKKTKAILTVDLYGQPCDYQQIRKIAKKYKLFLISDSCQAIGSKYKGVPIANYTDATIFSFYATKNITTIEGGAVVTNNKQIAQFCDSFRNHGKSQNSNEYLFPGHNFRTTDLASVIGINQLTKLEKWIKTRKSNVTLLNHLLKNVKGIITPRIDSDVQPNYHLYTIRVTDNYALSRDKLLSYLQKNGIGARVYYEKIIPSYKYMSKFNNNLKVAEKIAGEVLSLPVHPRVAKKDILKISSLIKRINM